MCLNPGHDADGRQFACRKCKQCIDGYQLDWAGRCIAEKMHSARSLFVTLTYGDDNLYGTPQPANSTVLSNEDVQLFIKSIRNDRYKVRYLCCGEYGDKKGRAHWHLLLFFSGASPDFRLDLPRFRMPQYWRHGFVEASEMTIGRVRYCMKYIQKNRERGVYESKFLMSRYPPLGDEYFRDRARRYVEQGLSPQDLKYGFADVRQRAPKDNPTKKMPMLHFWMHGKTRENFLQYFVDAWREKYGNNHWPYSLLLDEWQDEQARTAWERERAYMPKSDTRYAGRPDLPWADPPGGGPVEWSDTRQVWYSFELTTERRWFWSFNAKTGEREWSLTILSESAAENARNERERSPHRQAEYRRQTGRA